MATLTLLLGIGTAKGQTGPTINGNVYGGGNLADVGGSVTVNMSAGTVEKDVYGGGALANTNVNNATDYGKETEAITSTSANTTTVSLTGGIIKGDAYGGGLGQKDGFGGKTEDIEAVVYGDISLTLDGTAFWITYDDTDDDELDSDGNPIMDGENHVKVKVVKSGRVFGCNNLNGSPKGNVTVTVNKTVEGNTPRTLIDKRKSETPSDHSYELAEVYGGGNLAPYTTTGKKASVIINGCDETSILTVYGGGNAAEVPETDVKVYGTFEIGSVFGGGNGKDKNKSNDGWQTNPGANVNGNANTLIYGGTIHEAYGGSNEKGTITGNVAIDVSPSGETSCPLDVAKLVGAGKNADVNGDLIMVMGCKPSTKIPLLIAGADNANVDGNIELTITSGNFGKVFGGNNEGGIIKGHIKLNIEETGECETPITIDELYLGGNEAAYSMYGYYDAGTEGSPDYQPRTLEMTNAEDAEHYKAALAGRYAAPYAAPELNVISCTSIGKVFGGGFGSGATLYGNPTVNINMIQGTFANNIPAVMTAKELNASENPNKLGIIGDVFGGGNAADVKGNTTVNICTVEKVTLTSLDTDNVKDVVGAYITGSVYGGGNNAEVTGNTNVNIGRKK